MDDFRTMQVAFAAHLRDPDHAPPPPGIEDRRMAVYRDLFFNNVHGFMRNAFPVLGRTLGPAALERLVRDWFVEHRAHSPHFPEMPREFVDYLGGARGHRPGDPPWLAELAHYEWVELALELDQSDFDGLSTEGDLLAEGLARSPLAWPLAYTFPVHRIGPGFTPDAPGDTPTLLVVHRGRDDHIGFMTVNTVTWRLLELLEGHPGQTGRGLIEKIAAELGQAPGTLLEPGREALGRLLERDIIGFRKGSTP